MKTTETFSAQDRDAFRQLLLTNHETKAEVWVVIYKKTSGEPSITLEEAIEEALCFGWIDSSMNSLTNQMFIQRFIPRRRGSNWTEANETQVRRLISEGKMTKAGTAALPLDFIV